MDDEDFEWLKEYNWHVNKGKCTNYAVHTINKSYKNNKSIVELMHRKIIEYYNKIPEGYEIDHSDHNGLNNQKNNLRLATISQNAYNKQKTHGTSQFKGVYFKKLYNKWEAQIRINNKSIYLGLFTNEEEAARVYDKKAKELFGEFVYLNFPNK